MSSAYTRSDRIWLFGSGLLTVVFAVMFLGSGFGLRSAWPFWASLLCTSVFVWMPLMRRRLRVRDRVEVDDEGIRRFASGGARESVRWDELGHVFIAVSDEGGGRRELFWVFVDLSGQSGCAVPSSAEGFEDLLARVRALPGFDESAAVGAVQAPGEARVPVWRRPAG